MKYKIGTMFYLKGTKQRFVIADNDLSGNYYLVKYKDRGYAYLSYMQEIFSEEEIDQKFILDRL